MHCSPYCIIVECTLYSEHRKLQGKQIKYVHSVIIEMLNESSDGSYYNRQDAFPRIVSLTEVCLSSVHGYFS